MIERRVVIRLVPRPPGHEFTATRAALQRMAQQILRAPPAARRPAAEPAEELPCPS